MERPSRLSLIDQTQISREINQNRDLKSKGTGVPHVGSEQGARQRPPSNMPRLSPKSKSHAQPARGSLSPPGIYRRW
jgi:hypothetical protein